MLDFFVTRVRVDYSVYNFTSFVYLGAIFRIFPVWLHLVVVNQNVFRCRSDIVRSNDLSR